MAFAVFIPDPGCLEEQGRQMHNSIIYYCFMNNMDVEIEF